MNTSISQLNHNDEEKREQIDSINCKEIALDLSINLTDRMKSLEIYYENYDTEVMELINKLGGMYVFSGTKILENYFIDIVNNTTIYRERLTQRYNDNDISRDRLTQRYNDNDRIINIFYKNFSKLFYRYC